MSDNDNMHEAATAKPPAAGETADDVMASRLRALSTGVGALNDLIIDIFPDTRARDTALKKLKECNLWLFDLALTINQMEKAERDGK